MIEIGEKGGAAIFRVRVQPRASRTEVAGEHAGAIKLRIVAPPVEGKANRECIRFLARLLEVPPRAIEIVSGDSSRDKIIRVENMSAARVRDALFKSQI
ncbi:MAG TPA: DUF167 domain-containing protein [Blastocatellia bacterium]|nr:DUF167 domain-containing protein [Blastocatellia bacterium]